jgi:hypothetical protein
MIRPGRLQLRPSGTRFRVDTGSRSFGRGGSAFDLRNWIELGRGPRAAFMIAVVARLGENGNNLLSFRYSEVS